MTSKEKTMIQRLDKILSQAGVASRKELRDMIRAGRISINGVVTTKTDLKIDALVERITVDAVAIFSQESLVVVMNKPAGYLTATTDPHDPTVMDLLPKQYQNLGLKPVGRLDKDTEGMLVFTNDGPLLHRLISPKSQVEKTYVAEHEGTATAQDVEAFAKGISLRDGTQCLPAMLQSQGEGKSIITIHEGKYHQVRRMMASRGMHVKYLRRIGECGMVLGDLESGKCREVTPAERESFPR